MPKRSNKLPKDDASEVSKPIVDRATSDEDHSDPHVTDDGKNAAAVALGRLGGRKGGPARAKKLSAEKRSEIARKAAQSRWKDKGA